jgi:GH35 family endo-1,4-beta-xylanase
MSNLDRSIPEHRTTTATLKIYKDDNTPLHGQAISIAQKKHDFLLGCNAFDFVPLANHELAGKAKEQAEQKLGKFLQLFNFATLPFYWGQFEPVQGQPDTRRIMNAAKFCVDQGLQVKGHPLCWHTLAPDWLLNMKNDEILIAQRKRIQREVTGFAGLIDIWDVINEAVIMPIFNKYDNGITRLCKQLGRIETIRTVFAEARAANPKAVLLLNDFDVSPAFDILVEGCLEAGIKIDVIGIQSHMHQGYWGVEKTLQVLEQFERFRLPIHFTETTIISGQLMPPEIIDLNDYQVNEWPSTPEGEDRQAREVLLHYQTLFAHPLVAGITWWDFSDGKWLNAPSGLIRKDGSSKPAYEELLRIVQGKWRMAPTQFITDPEGKVDFQGLYGEYELKFSGKTFPFRLSRGVPGTIDIRL